MIGFDIGGTKCAVSLGHEAGNKIIIDHKESFATLQNGKETMKKMCSIAKGFNLQGESLGISVGGPMDYASGYLLNPPNLPDWSDFSLKDYAEQALGISCHMENDANACAFAEYIYGAGRGCENMIFLTFGTGLGAGLILNGKLYRGKSGNSGELGHIRLSQYGAAGYGKIGSFESFCSGAGMLQIANTIELTYRQRGELCGFNTQQDGIKEIAQKARQGDVASLELFDIVGEKLGEGLAILCDLLNPERIIIGSIFLRCEDLLRKPMEKSMKKEALPINYKDCKVLPSALGENIGDYGALSLCKL